MNEDYASANAEYSNGDKSDRVRENNSNNSTINDKNLLNDGNTIYDYIITREEDNAEINNFTNSEDRIVGMAEEYLQANIVRGPPLWWYPTSPNEINLNLNQN